MLILLLRRAWVQRRLLAAVVALVATACTLVGVCSLMMTVTADRAFDAEIGRSQPQDVSVTAYLVEVSGSDVAPARDEARSVLEGVLGPMRPTIETTANSRLRRLGSSGRAAYLTTTDHLEARASLTSGRWPAATTAGPPEAVVPGPTARLLDLDLGDRVTLDRELGLGGVDDAVTVTVVGTFLPLADAGWESDPLAGSGFAPAYSDGLEAAPTYGPFVVPESAFLASGSSVRGVRVTANPTLALARASSLQAAAASLDEASGVLASRVGDRARIIRVASELPRTLQRLDAQQASTRSTVLVVLLLGTALSLAAALLAGWLVASVREDQRDLLRAMGLGRRQQLGTAVLEALLLSTAATVVAVPAAAVVHSRLSHLAGPEAAGLQQGPTVTWGLVLAVLATALLLTMTLVATSVAASPAPVPSRRRAAMLVTAAPVLMGAAAFAWWQLRARPATAVDTGDVTLTLAPVVFVAALTVLGVGLVPLLLSFAARIGSRSRSLVLPLATLQAARRPHTGTSMVLVAATTAAAVFGLALGATWDRSQQDQAALRVGTDLSLTLPAPAGPDEAAEVEAAVRDQEDDPIISTVIHRPLALGRFVGQEGSRPVLVALDTRQADDLLRGRPGPGQTWADVVADLTPGTPVAGVAVPDGGRKLRLRGPSPAGAALTVTPTAVLEGPTGFRSSVAAAPIALDGTSHPVRWLSSPGSGQRLVVLRLELDGFPGPSPSSAATVSVSVSVPESAAGADGDAWRLLPRGEDSGVSGGSVALHGTGTRTELRTTFGVNLTYLDYVGVEVVATAFPAPSDLPVVVSQDLVDAVGARVGDELSAIVGDTVLALHVAAVAPSIPSTPGQVAVLADVDTLSRALIEKGRLEPLVDAWWVARPTPGVVRALDALELGDVSLRTDVADQLAQGPLLVSTPITLLTLVALAVALLLAAVALVLTAERHRRSAEVVRLRALGISRGDARRLLVLEHLAFFVPLVLTGTLVGATTALVLGPDLIRSDRGAAPVPRAGVVWPWTTELLVIGGLLLGIAIMTVVISALHVRLSDPARLREGGR